MTEEKYQNGDISWNTYSGVFKAFDKDGNEIKFPTEDTGYQVKLDVQGILNLYEENKGLKRIEELRIAQIENLKQENENAKATVEECHKYMAKLEDENEKLRKATEISVDKINVSVDAEVYHKMKKALEEIKEIAMGIMDEDKEETSCYYDANAIINKIDEVLGNECN